MATKTAPIVNSPSSSWIDLIDCEKIPGLGTYLFVEELLNSPHPTLKQIKIASKLFKDNSKLSISIHPPLSSDPKSFIEEMVECAILKSRGSPCAKELKESLKALQSNCSSDAFIQFAKSWSAFTSCYLQEKISQALSKFQTEIF